MDQAIFIFFWLSLFFITVFNIEIQEWADGIQMIIYTPLTIMLR